LKGFLDFTGFELALLNENRQCLQCVLAG